MANTEGLTDEVVSSMLAMPSPEEEQQQRASRPHQNSAAPAGQTKPKARGFPARSFARRAQMMELGEGEMPSATVIRSSKAPKIRSASSTKKGDGMASVAERGSPVQTKVDTTKTANEQKALEDNGPNKTKQKPVFLTDAIRERPVVDISRSKNSSSSATGSAKKESRFKQRNRAKNDLGQPTAGGFPSLDIAPVGSFTRKGRSARVQDSPAPTVVENKEGNGSNVNVPMKNAPSKIEKAGNDVGRATDSMMANMSLEDIRDGVDEAQSILSAESIAFLRKRGMQKKAKAKQSAMKGQRFPPKQSSSQDTGKTLTKRGEIQLEEKRAYADKEKMAELLTSVRTPEDMDRIYKEALQLGLAAELPSSTLKNSAPKENAGEEGMDERLKNLHIASSLLRSTAPRQRLLGARSLCDILEEDVNVMMEKRRADSFSASHDERESMKKTYPPLLPVAIRCLLDESIATFQTSGGRLLLSIVLRCIHALVTLFVHPYHVVNISPAGGDSDDPFILYQTCFMSDISHIPPSTELYPPTQIEPLGEGDTNKAAYRADSSAKTAESDSKAFYNDPAWTLLSRMRMLPCLSDVILCLSTDYSTGTVISEAAIQSICGILAILSVRSPGAAGAIARHKGILPFLVVYCLSPSDGITPEKPESKEEVESTSVELFNTGAALPALTLLCHLARQSRDIAELEMPFQTIIPDLQAILCVEAENDKELEVQTWSLVLLRILMRYGLATDHVQSLISIVAPRVELMRPENQLGAHYLLLFAHICDASKTTQQIEGSQSMPTIRETDHSLAMAGVWLSSPVRSCFASFQSVLNTCCKNHMKLASAQLRLMASYLSASTPTMAANSIPIVTKESSCDVANMVLESEMLERALTIALGASFNACWDTQRYAKANSLQDEAISCSFVSSLMAFVKTIGQEDLSSALSEQLSNKIMDYFDRSGSSFSPTASTGHTLHPSRQSWFIESEFAVLSMLCGGDSERENAWHALQTFAFSLLGRLNIGQEVMAWYIFCQERLHQVRNDAAEPSFAPYESIQTLFLRELYLGDRKLQLNHSSNIYLMGVLGQQSNAHAGSLNSLRCSADVAGGSNKSAAEEKFILPLGGTWMWNILSSTVTSQSERPPNALYSDGQHDKELLRIVSHALPLLLQLEMTSESNYTRSINDGTKLYHVANVCLLPEEILSDSFVGSTLDLLFKQLSGYSHGTLGSQSLVKDFIKASFEHSRLSKEVKASNPKDDERSSAEKKLQHLFEPDLAPNDECSKDELRALNDFVDDLCNSYIEYGGQYASFTNFIRLFLRHDFPSRIMTAVLTKLHPILHLLTIEEEETVAMASSLTESISGGLPSFDGPRRDPSSVLDAFSFSLKKRDKELLRSDYAYVLAVAFLSRNLASSSQRCECGLEAMKNRLSGVNDVVFYDIFQVGEKFLRSGSGTKASLISCVMDTCMDDKKGLTKQGTDTQQEWQWNSSHETAIWVRVVDSLRGVPL